MVSIVMDWTCAPLPPNVQNLYAEESFLDYLVELECPTREERKSTCMSELASTYSKSKTCILVECPSHLKTYMYEVKRLKPVVNDN